MFSIFECYSYSTIFVSDKFSLPDYSKYKKIKEEFLVNNHLYTNYVKPKKGDPIYFENDGRSFVGQNYSKKPILLLGDSYAYGLGLKKEETFASQLSEYTKRPVYNWGWCTEGMEYPLFLLKDKRNIDKLNGEFPEYVVYIYDYTPPTRITLKQRLYRWYYLRQLSLLGNQKYSVLDKLYSVNFIKNILFNKYLSTGNKEEKMFNLLSNILLEISNEVHSNFPNSKFVVLFYSDEPEMIRTNNLVMTEIEEKLLNPTLWKNLAEKNPDKLVVISTEELIGRKMNKPEDIIDNERTVTIHPSDKAWAEIVPAFAKKLNLN